MERQRNIICFASMFIFFFLNQISADWQTVNLDRANTLGDVLSRSCMYGFGISGLYSEYDVTTKDRLWRLNCTRIGFKGYDTCEWTKNFTNYWEQDVKFRCKDHNYISGLFSHFNKTTADRNWRVECCSSPGINFSVCIDTDWQNELLLPLEFNLPKNKVLNGLESQFDSDKSDRKWKFTICDIERS